MTNLYREAMLAYDVKAVLKEYPLLTVKKKAGIPVIISGTISITNKEGKPQGSYFIEVGIPEKYPYGFPSLHDPQKRIPRVPDRHMQSDGSACLEVLPKRTLVAMRGIRLPDFFSKYVYPYYCGQVLCEHGLGEWPKEWKHEDEGIKQYFTEVFQIEDSHLIAQMLEDGPFKAEDACPCGSAHLYSACHQNVVEEHLGLPATERKEYIHILRST